MASSTASEFDGERIASELVPSAVIKGDDEQDTILLRQMSQFAKEYASSFTWCGMVLDSYFGAGVGGIFAVFFLHIRPTRRDVDPWMWIVVGDVPPAYIPLADCKSPAEVFNTYLRGMTMWVEYARNGQAGPSPQGVPPVKLPATPEWADRINQKLYGLTLAVKHLFEDGGETLQQ